MTGLVRLLLVLALFAVVASETAADCGESKPRALRPELVEGPFGPAAPAAPGDLDLSFGDGGKVTLNLAGAATATTVLAQPDGKLVLGGVATVRSAREWVALARLGPDGGRDSDFGTSGVVINSFGPEYYSQQLLDATLQSDGSILVLFSCSPYPQDSSTPWLIRYYPDGRLDGWLDWWPLFRTYRLSAMVLNDDKTVWLAGSIQQDYGVSGNFVVARLLPDLSVDNSFGESGSVRHNLPSDRIVSNAMLIQPDGKLLVAGWPTLVRLNPDGSLDTAFGADGAAYSLVAHAVLLLPDGKIVVAGDNGAPDGGFRMARYTADGALDPTFGTGGFVAQAGFTTAYSLIPQPDGKLVAAGWPTLARFNSDGSLDPTFGAGGAVRAFQARGAATLWDSSLVAVSDSGRNFVVARYSADGQPDGGFGESGQAHIPVGTSGDWARSVAVRPGGQILGAGYIITGKRWVYDAAGPVTSYSAIVLSFLDDGQLAAVYSPPLAGERAYAGAADTDIAVLPDDRVLVMGDQTSWSHRDHNKDAFAVARLTADGETDATFGENGLAKGVVFDARDTGAMAVQADGRIILAVNRDAEHTLFRFLSNGMLDATFGDGGTVRTGNFSAAYGLALQPDGKIVAAGGYSDIALVRFTASGALDPAFGSGGLVTADFGGDDIAYDVVVLPDGKLVTAGSPTLARFLPDGTLDATFGDGGSANAGFTARALAVQPAGQLVVAGGLDGAFALARFTADGRPDTRLGPAGVITTPFASPATAYDLALQPDGKIGADRRCGRRRRAGPLPGPRGRGRHHRAARRQPAPPRRRPGRMGRPAHGVH